MKHMINALKQKDFHLSLNIRVGSFVPFINGFIFNETDQSVIKKEKQSMYKWH